MRTTTGLSTEAIYIFHNMLRKLSTTYKPEYIAAVFESGADLSRGSLRRLQSQPHGDAARIWAIRFPTSADCWKPCAFRSCNTRDSRPTM